MINSRSEETIWPFPAASFQRREGGPSWAHSYSLSPAHTVTRTHPPAHAPTAAHTYSFTCPGAHTITFAHSHTETHSRAFIHTHIHIHRNACTHTMYLHTHSLAHIHTHVYKHYSAVHLGRRCSNKVTFVSKGLSKALTCISGALCLIHVCPKVKA